MAKAIHTPKPPHGTPSNNIPAPTGLTVTKVSPTEVYVSWNPVPGATSYWVYRDQYVPAIIQNTFYTDGFLTPGAHVYAVAAVVNSTLGTKSSSVTITI